MIINNTAIALASALLFGPEAEETTTDTAAATEAAPAETETEAAPEPEPEPAVVATTNTAGSGAVGVGSSAHESGNPVHVHPDDEGEGPQGSALQRRVATRGGREETKPKKNQISFHGFFNAPMRVGSGRREDATESQKVVTFHNPLVPDDQYLSASHTRHNNRSWAELYFGYGNETARGTVAIEAFNFTDAGFNQQIAQFGIAQAFLTVNPPLRRSPVKLNFRVGAFDARYGMAGKYDLGEYETYLFGRTRALGEVSRVEIPVRNFSFWIEHGIGATRPDPNIYNTSRFTLLHHGHLGAAYKQLVQFGVHYMGAYAREEDREGDLNPGVGDGAMHVMGPDLRLDLGRGGYWYAGYSYIDAIRARSVGPAIEVIHSQGGGNFSLGIVDNYLEGPTGQSNGNGEIHTVLFQTDHSIRKIIQGDKFWGEGRDATVSLYGMINKIRSDDPDANGNLRIKYGTDVVGALMPWLAAAVRYDRVQPNSDIPEQSFAILSPRLIFRTAWISREQISIQYSRYFYNQRECDPMGNPLLCVQAPAAAGVPDGLGATSEDQNGEARGAPIAAPDLQVVTLTASVWW